MNTPAAAIAGHPAPPAVATWLTLLLAAACGLIAANLYYAQPLAGPISAALGLTPQATGLIVTLTQIGYGLGLLLVVPLGDLFENRRLVVSLIGVAALALLGAALATHPLPFLVCAWFTGLGSVAVQVLVPYAAHLAPEAARGRVVGNVMSGLMLGIMLARPVASFITALSSWHMVFYFSAAAMALLALLLGRMLPRRVPPARLRYGALLVSMAQLVRDTPLLRRRALYHACLFAVFSLFWTTTPLLLAGPEFNLSQGGIALVALAGVAGAIAPPFAGRIADRGWSYPATGVAMLAVAAALLMTRLGTPGSTLHLALLVAAGVLLDFAVAANFTFGQRAIFALGAEIRARLNSIFMTTFFIGGAIGSAVGGWAYAHGGWSFTVWVGLAFPAAALAYYATER